MEVTNVKNVQRDDIVIAFMGPSGSGKSYFIDLLAGQTGRRSGHSLMSVTSQVHATRVRHPRYGDRIVLVDFPGFDDKTRTNLEILQMISDWLGKTYERDIKLSGIIYLHPITDNRMSGPPLMNLRLFGALCGNVAMSRVLFVSTMWQKVRLDVGTSRESELRHTYWSPFTEQGAAVGRLERADAEEAWSVIEKLIRTAYEGEVLLIQEELVDLEKSLRETMAGKMLYAGLQRLLADQRESLKHLLAQIEQSGNPSLAKELKKEYERIGRQFETTFEEAKRLKITYARRAMISVFGKQARAKPVYSYGGKDTTQVRFSDTRISNIRMPEVRLPDVQVPEAHQPRTRPPKPKKSDDTGPNVIPPRAQALKNQHADSKGPGPNSSVEVSSLASQDPGRQKALGESVGPARLPQPNKDGDTGPGVIPPRVRALENRHADSKGLSPDSSGLLEAFSLALQDPGRRKALGELVGPDAQLMIDYIHYILLQPELPKDWLRKHSRIALYKLCSASALYPRCYVLKGITKPDSAEASGGFGDVYKARHGDKFLCLKVVRLRRKSELEPALKLCAKEGMVWGELCHPNILPFYGFYYLNEQREQVCLVSPWMNRGDLVTYLGNDPSIPRAPFIHDIASGLEYLHSEGVVHGDIKGANVLVNDSGRACIADFGLASIPVDQTLVYSRGATTVGGCSYRWSAPELLDDGAHMTRESDVWAFGCVCYEIFIGKPPFYECTLDAQIMRNLIIGTSPIGSVRPPQIDSDMWALMEHCCTFDPIGRPEFRIIVEKLKGSSVADPGEPPVDTLPEGKQFLNEMRGGKGALTDLRGVQQIFDKIQQN